MVFIVVISCYYIKATDVKKTVTHFVVNYYIVPIAANASARQNVVITTFCNVTTFWVATKVDPILICWGEENKCLRTSLEQFMPFLKTLLNRIQQWLESFHNGSNYTKQMPNYFLKSLQMLLVYSMEAWLDFEQPFQLMKGLYIMHGCDKVILMEICKTMNSRCFIIKCQ